MVTAKLLYYIHTKDASIQFLCSDYLTEMTLDNMCDDIERHENNTYKSGLSVYKTWEKENIKKQDEIKQEISCLEQEIKDYRKHNRFKLIFNKETCNELNQKYSQLKQKNDQLNVLIDKKNKIELKRKDLEESDDDCLNIKQYNFKNRMENFLNDLEFHRVDSLCTDGKNEVIYEFYGDEKELIKKAENSYREIIIMLSTNASWYLTRAIEDCDTIDKGKDKDKEKDKGQTSSIHKNNEKEREF